MSLNLGGQPAQRERERERETPLGGVAQRRNVRVIFIFRKEGRNGNNTFKMNTVLYRLGKVGHVVAAEKGFYNMEFRESRRQ